MSQNRTPAFHTGRADPPDWHRLPGDEVADRLNVDTEHGLDPVEAGRRLERHGPNEIRRKRGRSPLGLFLDQFKDVMVLVLLGATAISYALGEVADTLAILVIVTVNAVLGFAQEYRAERSLEALRRLTAPEARVVRGGRPMAIPARELVPGDVLLVEAGDRMPADARILLAANLEAEESALTGESQAVTKSAAADPRPDLPLGDRRGMLFQGTVITRGRGRAVVVATGMETEMGRIAGMIQSADQPDTPLQRRLAQLGAILVAACLAVSAAVVVGGVLQGRDPYFMFFTGVSLAVAAIPEGLPAIVTIALALGVQRMIRVHAIIRRLPAVETLGCATVICSDKTGTLTTNAMTARVIYADGRWLEVTGEGYAPEGRILLDGEEFAVEPDSALHEALYCAALCNNASVSPDDALHGRPAAGAASAEPEWRAEGDPTEAALLVLARKGGVEPEELAERLFRVAEIPFESERRRMSVVVAGRGGSARGGAAAAHVNGTAAAQANGAPTVYVKGAPADVVARCTHVRIGDRLLPLTEARMAQLREVHDMMAASAFRVLALACREWALPERGEGSRLERGEPTRPERLDPDEVERGLTLLGVVGLIDPPRPEVRRAIQDCHRAGLRAVMITGDHAKTAEAIARELGMLPPQGRILTGPEVDGMTDTELAAAAADTYVFARVSPAHKLRIVRAFRARGEVVAMTGDGVNDAPAVKEADIGVAMGKTGTEVTKEASAMILTDDNFATIVAAIREGRAIYDNVRKFVRYLLACNTGEILLMLLATFLGAPLPLLPIQMLLVNLVTDGLPALALGVDPADGDVMRRRPRDPREGVFARGLARLILVRGVVIGVMSLWAFLLAYHETGDLDLARTVAMATLCVSQLMHSFDARSEYRGVLQAGIFANRALVAAAVMSFAVLWCVIYLPGLSGAFHSEPLDGEEWAFVLLASSAGAILGGAYNLARKLWHRRRARLEAG